ANLYWCDIALSRPNSTPPTHASYQIDFFTLRSHQTLSARMPMILFVLIFDLEVLCSATRQRQYTALSHDVGTPLVMVGRGQCSAVTQRPALARLKAVCAPTSSH